MENELVKAVRAVLAKYNDVLREANKIPFDDTANIFENLRTALAAHEKAGEGMQIAGLGQIILDEIRQDGTIATMPERIEGLIAARLAGAGVKVSPDRDAVIDLLWRSFNPENSTIYGLAKWDERPIHLVSIECLAKAILALFTAEEREER